MAGTSGSLTTSMNLLAWGSASSVVSQVLSGDFNGDGKSDIWSFEDSYIRIYSLTGTSLTLLYAQQTAIKNHCFTLGDFNGDGKTDMFMYGIKTSQVSMDWNEWEIHLSNGVEFEIQYIPALKVNLKYDNVRIGDFNGDGSSDVMATSADVSWYGTWFFISKNYGTGMYAHKLTGYPVELQRYNIADFDGDGRDDFLSTDSASPWWNGYHLYKSGSKNSILLEKIGNGIGNLTKISYKPVSRSDAPYTKGSGAVFPVMDYQGPVMVVSTVLNSDGLGNLNSTGYRYQGIKIHRQGKGYLCMEKQIVSTVTDTTEYSYSYHTSKFFTQLITMIKKAGSTTLSTLTND